MWSYDKTCKMLRCKLFYLLKQELMIEHANLVQATSLIKTAIIKRK